MTFRDGADDGVPPPADDPVADASWNHEYKFETNLQGHNGNCYSIQSGVISWGGSPRPFLFTGSRDKTVKMWDVQTRTCKATLKGHESGVWNLLHRKVNDIDWLFSCSFDRAIRVWDLTNLKPIGTYVGHQSGVYSLAFHSSGDKHYLLSGSDDTTIKLWNVGRLAQQAAGEAKLQQQKSSVVMGVVGLFSASATLQGHERTVAGLQVDDATGVLYSASMDRTIKSWDCTDPTKPALDTFTGHGQGVLSLAVHAPNVFYSGSHDKCIAKWDARQGGAAPVDKFDAHSHGVFSLAVFGDVTLFSASHDGTIKVWDVRKNECRQVLRGHNKPIWKITALGNTLFSAASEKHIKMWSDQAGIH